MSAIAGAVVLSATGCGTPSGTGSELGDDINVASTMMQEGEPLPAAYTCEGDGISPALQWSGVPDDDRIASLAVVVDAPEDATVFWVLYDLSPEITEIRQNSVPQPGRQGRNSVGRAAYEPPCPENGEPHEYRFTVYALNGGIDLPEDAPLAESLDAIAERAVARGSLITTSE
ncbi:MAG: YbhB/YbcL family Raf kinase inhibitor-like protein [Nocardiopsaceae bacterium]|nr:YbhB/YbcL family Raf kinase inhibitor-like protein [Nocardiopsaceae bacterium]